MGAGVKKEEAPLQEAGTRQGFHQGQRRVPMNKLTPPPPPCHCTVNCILFPIETRREGARRLSSRLKKAATWQPWG